MADDFDEEERKAVETEMDRAFIDDIGARGGCSYVGVVGGGPLACTGTSQLLCVCVLVPRLGLSAMRVCMRACVLACVRKKCLRIYACV